MTITEMMADATPQDYAFLAGLVVGIPFVFMAMLTFFATFFVALNSPPTTRAMWSVGPPFLLVGGLMVWGFSDGEGGPIALLLPLGSVVAALILFVWWRFVFGRAYYEDEAELPDGQRAENTDWRIGLGFVLAFFAMNLAWAFISGAL